MLMLGRSETVDLVRRRASAPVMRLLEELNEEAVVLAAPALAAVAFEAAIELPHARSEMLRGVETFLEDSIEPPPAESGGWEVLTPEDEGPKYAVYPFAAEDLELFSRIGQTLTPEHHPEIDVLDMQCFAVALSREAELILTPTQAIRAAIATLDRDDLALQVRWTGRPGDEA